MTTSIPSINLPTSLGAAQDGIQRGLSQVARASQAIARGEITPENSVDLIQGQRTVEMNVKALQTTDEMIGTLLSVKA